MMKTMPERVMTLGKLFTHMPSSITWYQLHSNVWEGNCRYGFALAMRHRLMVYPLLYVLKRPKRKISTPTLFMGYGWYSIPLSYVSYSQTRPKLVFRMFAA